MNRYELLHKWESPLSVLDHGFVRLVDVMGDDAAIVQAARASYGNGTKTQREDRDLIRYLLRHRHTSPFEMVEIKLHVKLPIFVERQWIRHRTASVNEVSGRYSELPEEFYLPDVASICKQATDNKQGRGEPLTPDEAAHIRSNMNAMGRDEFKHYRFTLNQGVSRELARINLPLSTYTEKYWKVDGHNLFHFLQLRMDHHAQWEIREYAKAVAKIVSDWLPCSWEAFQDYRLGAVTFSAKEMEILREIVSNWKDDEREAARAEGRPGAEDAPLEILRKLCSGKLSNREASEFLQKVG